jgi:uroporphyrinogen-III synthase
VCLLPLLQIEELQDQLAKAAQHNKGVGSDKLLLQQLNAVEAAYAELQEAMVRARKKVAVVVL